MAALELFEHLRVRRVAAFCLLDGRKPQPFKEHLAKLLGRVDVEFLPGIAENIRLIFLDADLEHIAERDERHLVDEYAPRLHPRQHRAKGQFDLIIELLHAAFAQLPGQQRIERRNRRRLGQKRCLFRRFLPDPRFVRIADLRAAILRENVIQLIIAPRRVQIIGSKRRVEKKTFRRDAALEKRSHEALAVMCDFLDRCAEQS